MIRAAEAALAKRKFVTAIDVLVGVGWLEPRRVDEWRQGRVEYLERVTVANLGKISTAMRSFRRWAQARGLKPSETAYLARTPDRRPLRFSKSGDPGIEQAYRTHWVSPELSEKKRARLAERESRPPELVVVSPLGDFTCSACGEEQGGWLIMEDSGPICMACADMAHLVFLPSGDAALTRRAKAGSRLSAVVVRLFPGCPPERAQSIARHASVRGSGRVGRSAAGRALEPEALELAVAAAIRHEDTRYDELLMSGIARETARAEVRDEVGHVLEVWRR